MQVCNECGCGFVEVSSHYGARPSHQDWKGRVYSLNGRVTVDGVTYEDFGESTGYYGEGDHGALGDRLQGVNCRHHFGPWLPGMPCAFHPNPKHPSGKSNEETYKLTQKQRTLERALRDTRRELSAAPENYKRFPNEKTQLAVNQLKAQLKSQNDKMKALLAKNKGILTRQPARESVGNLPRVKVPADTKPKGGVLADEPRFEGTDSPIAKASDFDALDELLFQRAGGGMSRDVRAFDFARSTADSPVPAFITFWSSVPLRMVTDVAQGWAGTSHPRHVGSKLGPALHGAIQSLCRKGADDPVASMAIEPDD